MIHPPCFLIQTVLGVWFIQRLPSQVSQGGEHPCLLAANGCLIHLKSLDSVTSVKGTGLLVLQDWNPFVLSCLGLPPQHSPSECNKTAMGRRATEPDGWRHYLWCVFSQLMTVRVMCDMSWGYTAHCLTAKCLKHSWTQDTIQTILPRPEWYQPSYGSRMLVFERLFIGSLQFAIALATQKALVMTVCISVRRQSFNTHGHGYKHQVWTQILPTLPCQWPQDMKFPWKNVTAVPAINPLGRPSCWGLAKTQGCLPGCQSTTSSTTPAQGAEARTQLSCSQGRGHGRCRGSSLHDILLGVQEAGLMRRGDAARQGPRLPHFWEARLSPLPAFREARAAAGTAQHRMAPACSFHWNPLLWAIYILFLERDRKPNESEPSMVTSPQPLPGTALGGPRALMEMPLFGFVLSPPLRWDRRGPEAPVPSILEQWVGTRNHTGPGETEGR